MARRAAHIVICVSVALLVAAASVWLVGRSTDGRADLVGESATTTSTPPLTAAPATSTTMPLQTTTTAPRPASPVGLVIPALGVDAQVVPVGLEPDGEMEVPPASQAGWYRYGPRPGDPGGTAVIAAHVDYAGQRGVFFDLRSLQVGAEVLVADEAGAQRRFVVTERYQVDKDELPIELIFVADGPPILTLITCGGSFDRGAHSYRDNIVVRAEPVAP